MLVAVLSSVLVATTLLATGPVLSTALAEAGLRARLEQAPSDEIGVEVEVRTGAATATAAAEAATIAIERSFGELLDLPDVAVLSGTVRLVGTDADVITAVGTRGPTAPSPVDTRPDQDPLLDRSERTDPSAGAVPVLLHEGAQSFLGVGVGDELVVEDGARLEVVGTLTTRDEADPRWWGDRLWRDGVAVGESFTTVGPLVPVGVPIAQVVGEPDPRVVVTVRALPRIDELRPDQLAELRRRAAALEREAERRLGDVVDLTSDRWTVRTPIATAAVDSTVQLSSTRAAVLATVAQVAVLALYTLGLAGRLLRSGREVETMLVRARGATPGQLGAAALVEGLVVVTPALVAGPYLAVVATRVLGRLELVGAAGLSLRPRVEVAAVVAAGIAAVACLALLVWPAVTAARDTYASAQGARGRRRAVTVVQSSGIDLALVAIAAIGVWQLRVAGSPVVAGLRTDPDSVDVVLVTAPALGLLAGALLVLRLVPAVARAGERLVDATRGLVASLSGWQVARRPDAVARPTLLLVLGVAIGVLVTTYATTWDESQRDQAAAAVGAEVAAVADVSAGALPPQETATALASIEGVDDVAPAITTRMRLPGGALSGTIVGFDAADPLLLAREDVAPTVPFATLDVPRVAGLALPDGDSLGVVATLAPDPDWPGRDATLAPVLRDGDGLVHRLGDVVVPAGVPLELTWDVAALRRPAALLGWEVETVSGSADGSGSRVAPEGTSDRDVLASLPAPVLRLSIDGLVVDGASVSVDDVLWRTDPAEQRAPTIVAAEAEGTTVTTSGLELRARTGRSPQSGERIVLRVVVVDSVPADAGQVVVPAIVHPDVLAASGRQVGEVLEVTSAGTAIPVEVVGTIDVVPGAVDDPLPVLVDVDAISAARWAQRRVGTRADLWHVDVGGLAAGGDGAASLAASRTLVARIGGGEVNAPSVRTTVIDAAGRRADPIAIGLVVALALGAVAAVVLALLGTLTSAAVGVRERAPEFALLQAVGVSMRQVRWWLAWEIAVVVVIGLGAGALLGAALVWAVLPTLGLAADGSLAVPAPRVVVPYGRLAAGAVTVVAAFALVPLALARSVSRAHVAEVLRLGGEG